MWDLRLALSSTDISHIRMQTQTQIQAKHRYKHRHKYKYNYNANTNTDANANADENTYTVTNTREFCSSPLLARGRDPCLEVSSLDKSPQSFVLSQHVPQSLLKKYFLSLLENQDVYAVRMLLECYWMNEFQAELRSTA